MNHTTGPWTYEERCGGIAVIKPETETDEEIITASIIPKGDEDECSDEDEANAKLIATAPELLSDLIGICNYVAMRQYDVNVLRQMVEQAKFTIKKATQ